MSGVRGFIKRIRLKNLLSFGETFEGLELEKLNVLIGPNSSGKSNLIEALTLLAAAPKDLAVAIRRGGGIGEWLWKGGETTPEAEIEVEICYPATEIPIRHWMKFTRVGGRFEMLDESVEDSRPTEPGQEVEFYYRYQGGKAFVDSFTALGEVGEFKRQKLAINREQLKPYYSALSAFHHPLVNSELSILARFYSGFKFYTEWNFGRYSDLRRPGQTDMPSDFLLEDASNLALVLNNLQAYPESRKLIPKKLKRLNPRIEDLSTGVFGGTIQLFLHEEGVQQPIPASRMSDGTLRYLCLLALLLHPEPPPLLCIEEPELGLHPDVLPDVAELLVEASERTQIVVTTHSDVLVSAFSERPECVLVCERDDKEGTRIRRLDGQSLSEWLERYTLGELWRMGELGGTT